MAGGAAGGEEEKRGGALGEGGVRGHRGDVMAEETLDREPTRRGFINWFLGTSAVAFLLSVFYPVGRYLIPPPVAESTAGTVTLPLKAEDVKPNTGQIFKFGNRPAILVRTTAGELRAFSAVCTPLHCPVQYRPDLGHLR